MEEVRIDEFLGKRKELCGVNGCNNVTTKFIEIKNRNLLEKQIINNYDKKLFICNDCYRRLRKILVD